MSVLRIAIIGAGPAGCCLARILLQSSAASQLSVTIYEGEASLNVRSQGGTLDLRQGTGLDAIRAANLVAEFEKYARYDGENMICTDKYMKAYVTMSGNQPDDKTARAPEIDRFRLRQILLESLPKNTIQWSKRLSKVKQDDDDNGTAGALTLYFQDGTTASGCDLVIGADGAWSKVRPLLTSVRPYFSEVIGYALTIANASKVASDAVKLVNRGSCYSQHDHFLLIQQQMGEDVMQVTAYWKTADEDDTWMKKTAHDSTNVEQVRDFLLNEKLQTWHPDLKTAIAAADSSNATVRSDSLYMLPVAQRWNHRDNVTLIGDAAHLMTPFAGEGVNQALTDAKVLAGQIVDALSEKDEIEHAERVTLLNAAVVRYEEEMFGRMAKVMALTQKMKEIFFSSPGGLYRNIEACVIAAVQDELPLWPITLPLVALATYIYYFFWRLWHRPQQ